MKTTIKAIEYYLPEKMEDMRTLKNDNPEWDGEKIYNKTGIDRRHIAGPNESVVDMANNACQKLFNSKIKEKVDFLIFITQSPEHILPPSACILHERLSLRKDVLSFDVNLGCSGFIYGLAIAGSIIESGLAKEGLVVCAEKYTKYIEKSNRTCRPIFSDGAAAVYLSSAVNNDCLGPFDLGTDGSGYKDLIVPSFDMKAGDKMLKPNELFMDGAKVFMFTMSTVPRSIMSVCKKAGIKIHEIDYFIFHQASKFVIDNISRRLDLPPEKVYVNYDKIGNVVSASLPIALKNAVKEMGIPEGSCILLAGFGVGLSWGSCLIKLGGDL